MLFGKLLTLLCADSPSVLQVPLPSQYAYMRQVPQYALQISSSRVYSKAAAYKIIHRDIVGFWGTFWLHGQCQVFEIC